MAAGISGVIADRRLVGGRGRLRACDEPATWRGPRTALPEDLPNVAIFRGGCARIPTAVAVWLKPPVALSSVPALRVYHVRARSLSAAFWKKGQTPQTTHTTQPPLQLSK